MFWLLIDTACFENYLTDEMVRAASLASGRQRGLVGAGYACEYWSLDMHSVSTVCMHVGYVLKITGKFGIVFLVVQDVSHGVFTE